TGDALNAVLRWAAAGCAVRRMASSIQGAAMRISGLVTAVKGFTSMDQAMSAQDVDVGASLGDAVVVLNGKAREKSVEMRVEVEEGLPPVHGGAGRLSAIC